MNITRLAYTVWTGLFLTVSLAFTATAQAGQPVLDNGSQVNPEDPYTNAQPINNVFENKAIHGKLIGDIPVDIYTFTPDKDGEQTFRLLVTRQERNDLSQPFLILVDPTEGTEASQIGLDVPGENYHTAIITAVDPGKNHTEGALLTKYSVAAEQKVKLTKDAKYYLVVFDIGRQVRHYTVGIGEGPLWGGKDFFSSFGSWFKVKTDNYAGSSPFVFNLTTLGYVIFFLGVLVLIGTWIIHELYSILARYRTSSESIQRWKDLLPYSRILFWFGLWFTAVGGYIYFSKKGWDGIPFVLLLLFIPLAVAVLYLTIRLYPEIQKVSGSGRDAFSLMLRRWLLAFTVVSGLSAIAFVTYLSIYLA